MTTNDPPVFYSYISILGVWGILTILSLVARSGDEPTWRAFGVGMAACLATNWSWPVGSRHLLRRPLLYSFTYYMELRYMCGLSFWRRHSTNDADDRITPFGDVTSKELGLRFTIASPRLPQAFYTCLRDGWRGSRCATLYFSQGVWLDIASLRTDNPSTRTGRPGTLSPWVPGLARI